MAFKCVLMYNQNSRGFTETWYSKNESIPLFALPVKHGEVFKQAIRFRNPKTILFGARYSDETNPRNSVFWPLSRTWQSGITSTDTPDPVSTDATWLITGSNTAKRRISIRGLPDDSVKRDVNGNDVVTAGFRQGVDTYIAAVKDAVWSIKYLIKPSVGGLQMLNVKLLEPNAVNPNWTTVTLVQAPAGQLIAGGRVRFSNPPKGELAGFPRLCPIIDVDNANKQITIPYRWRGGVNFGPKSMGAISVAYDYDAVLDWFFERFSERKTGKPFGSLAGRSRAVARAR